MEFEEILFRAKQDDEVAKQQILELYRPMLIRYSLIDGRLDEDLHQELCLEVLKCIRYFKKVNNH